MRKALLLMACLVAGAAFAESYVGGSGAIMLPQGGSRFHHVGGAAFRAGHYLGDFFAVEGEVGWLEDEAALAVQGLWHWWGFERFDPFFTFGARGWLGRDGNVGPKVGTGAFYHFTDEWALRLDVDVTLGLDTGAEADYTLGFGVQYSF